MKDVNNNKNIFLMILNKLHLGLDNNISKVLFDNKLAEK